MVSIIYSSRQIHEVHEVLYPFLDEKDNASTSYYGIIEIESGCIRTQKEQVFGK